jgi:NADPH2:quinone reductase
VKPTLPFVPGMEVSGIVRSAPKQSASIVGRRVVALTGVTGGCAELAAVPPQYVCTPHQMTKRLGALEHSL